MHKSFSLGWHTISLFSLSFVAVLLLSCFVTVAQSKVMGTCICVLFQEFYSFRLYLSVCDPSELISVHGVRSGSIFIPMCVDIQLSQQFLLKRFFIQPLNSVGTLIENQLFIDTWAYF